MSGTVTVPDHVLVGYTSYAMGRASGIAGEATGVIRAAWPSVSSNIRSVLRRDIRRWLHDVTVPELRHPLLGDSDIQAWRDLTTWLDQHTPPTDCPHQWADTKPDWCAWCGTPRLAPTRQQ